MMLPRFSARRLSAVLVLGLLLLPQRPQAWGFFGHRTINRLAVYTLPPELLGFYKTHIDYLTENATRPDSRRSVVPEEAPRHYIDLDVYGDSAAYRLPRNFADAVARYSNDTLQRHGIVPWHVVVMKNRLTEAFRSRNPDRILAVSADLGHYVADACVPLHTTRNYNGQLTGQRGIHGLWESRLPELLASGYDFFTGPAPYLERPGTTIWATVTRSNAAVDSVLRFERELTASFPDNKKYTFEQRGNQTVRTYSREFSREYHQRLNGQVERQMRLAVRLVGAFWYSAWVDAGQPDLRNLPSTVSAEEQQRLTRENEQLQQAPAGNAPGHAD